MSSACSRPASPPRSFRSPLPARSSRSQTPRLRDQTPYKTLPNTYITTQLPPLGSALPRPPQAGAAGLAASGMWRAPCLRSCDRWQSDRRNAPPERFRSILWSRQYQATGSKCPYPSLARAATADIAASNSCQAVRAIDRNTRISNRSAAGRMSTLDMWFSGARAADPTVIARRSSGESRASTSRRRPFQRQPRPTVGLIGERGMGRQRCGSAPMRKAWSRPVQTRRASFAALTESARGTPAPSSSAPWPAPFPHPGTAQPRSGGAVRAPTA